MKRAIFVLSLVLAFLISFVVASQAGADIPTPKCTAASSKALDRDPSEVSTRTCTQKLPFDRVGVTARATVRGKWGKVTRVRAKVVKHRQLAKTRAKLVRDAEKAAVRAYKRKYG